MGSHRVLVSYAFVLLRLLKGVFSGGLSSLAQEWYDKGETLEVPGTASTRLWREGNGPPVVCLHGVPVSAYVYRKLLPELAERGLEGIAIDFPGVGFSARPNPKDFDYSWSGLSRHLSKALDEAGIEKFHLVVHDIGGPVGFEFVARFPDRVLSLTALDTIVNVASFEIPLVMRPFLVPLFNRFYLKLLTTFIVPAFRHIGVFDEPSRKELRVHGELLTLGDHGSAFLAIMNSFERTVKFEKSILDALGNRTFPVQVIWGEFDPILNYAEEGVEVKTALRLEPGIHLVEGKHFLQEDAYIDIADRIALLVNAGDDI